MKVVSLCENRFSKDQTEFERTKAPNFGSGDKLLQRKLNANN